MRNHFKSKSQTHNKIPLRYVFTVEMLAMIRERLDPAHEIRPIPWAPGYAVSAAGFVISIRKWNQDPTAIYRVLRTMRHTGGYPQVNLTVSRKSHIRTVHTLVAEAFLGPKPFPGAEVRHRDGNPENNAVANLLWSTHADNMADCEQHGTLARGERNGHAVLTAVDVQRVRALALYGVPLTVVAPIFGVCVAHATAVARGEEWRHVCPSQL